jgi:DNA polymerase III alpha subunit
MRNDNYGQQVLTENDLCDFYLKNPDRTVKRALVETALNIPAVLDLDNKPQFTIYQKPSGSVENFDKKNQNLWFIPQEYAEFDIAKYVLDLCESEAELQRVGDELLKFQERDLFMLLRYLKYLVDTMRKHNVVWGVGRGSSVSSYVLYLLGVHRINSLHYDLSIDEFLK